MHGDMALSECTITEQYTSIEMNRSRRIAGVKTVERR